MATLFPVTGLSAEERYEYWHDVVCKAYGPTRNRPLDDSAFDGSLEVKNIGGIQYSKIQSTPIAYDRPRATEHCEQFFLSLTLCSETLVEQSGRESKQTRGDIVLYDGSKPYSCSFPGGDDQIVLVVPRQLLLTHVPRADEFLSRTLSIDSPLGRLATSMLTEVWCAPNIAAAAGPRLNASLLDVVSTAFDSAFGISKPAVKPRQAIQLQRVKEFLLDNLQDPALTIDSIAQVACVAPRTLNRLFASEGTTAIRWLWTQRLIGCHDALIAGRYSQVTDAAFSYGFTNLSHFSHAFKKAYGISPQTLLRAV